MEKRNDPETILGAPVLRGQKPEKASAKETEEEWPEEEELGVGLGIGDVLLTRKRMWYVLAPPRQLRCSMLQSSTCPGFHSKPRPQCSCNCLNYQDSSLPVGHWIIPTSECFYWINKKASLPALCNCTLSVIRELPKVGIILFILCIRAVTTKIIQFLKILVLFM